MAEAVSSVFSIALIALVGTWTFAKCRSIMRRSKKER